MNRAPSIQLLTNAVIAQYIHEISVRHRSRSPDAASGSDARPLGASKPSARPRRPLHLLEPGLATVARPD